MNCGKCKHFDTTEDYPYFMGWCDLKFPVWFYRNTGIDIYDYDKTVRKDDSCSFFMEEK